MQILRVLKLYYQVTSSHLPAPQVLRAIPLQSRQFSSSSSPDTPRTKVVLPCRQFSFSSSPATPRTKVVLQSRQFSSSSSLYTPRTKVVLQSRQFSSSSSPDTPRTKVVLQSRQFSSYGHRTNRTFACTSRTRHARSPKRVAPEPDKSHSRLHFARSTRTISAEGCAGTGQIALSPTLRALDMHDLRRGLRGHRTNRALACVCLLYTSPSPRDA